MSGRVVKTGSSTPVPSTRKVDLGSFRAPDPVPLHRQHPFGPGLEQRHLVEQPVGVIGDPEEPLLEVLGHHLRAAALAPSVDHLLVRENRLIDRAPLDRRLAAVGEPCLEEAEEEPLRPPVVRGIARRELPRPVDRPAHSPHLPPDRVDVPLGDRPRMAALPDRSVLGRQAERVVAHRAQNGDSLPPTDVTEHVAERVVEDVPHVELARGVREHLEDVRPGAVVDGGRISGVGDDERLLALPHLLPLALDGLRVVPLHGSHDRTEAPRDTVPRWSHPHS